MSDCRAHWCRGRETVRDDGPNLPGPELPLVQVPCSFITSDFAYFEFNGYGTPMMLHPQSIGWGGRVAMLERVVEHCLGELEARPVTAETIADEFRGQAAAIR